MANPYTPDQACSIQKNPTMLEMNRIRNLGTALSLLLAGGLALHAQNPVIGGLYSADPTARVFDGKVYLYPSHDIISPVEPERRWFCMADYHVYSSENLTDWTDHGVILSQENVPWGNPEGYSMWAPDCVQKDGKYYFYYPNAPKSGRGFAIGVATADSPAGPFTAQAEPIKGVMGIDPCVLVDKDGSSYIYWSGMGLRGCKLADDMLSIEGESVRLDEDLPAGFKEGPFIFERNGIYYLTYPWVRDRTETLAYATSDKPLGPYKFKGIIMEQSPSECWTNHHSIVEYKGQWYLFYHHNDYSASFDKNRSVRIDKLSFNQDGDILPVTPTLRGVGITPSDSKIQVDRYSAICAVGTGIDYLDPAKPFDGWFVSLRRAGTWLRYDNVDYGQTAPTSVTVRMRSEKGGSLLISSAEETPLTVVCVPAGGEWTEVEAPLPVIKEGATGVGSLRLTLQNGENVDIDWVSFKHEARPLAENDPAVYTPWKKGAFKTGQYRNVFVEMGYSPEAVDAKLAQVFDEVFYGPDKVYFEVGDSLAYISDIKNHDVRTEGMSYGMMIAVQFDRKDIFDRLWRWCRKYMQHQDGPLEGYFAWSCKTDGTRNAEGPASDGELYYVTSLLFASNRWGDNGEFNYKAEARHILDCSFAKNGEGRVMPLINDEHKLITFTPDLGGGRFTDPSYHIPAFYEVWARYAGDGRAKYWKACAKAAREYLHKATDPQTGLNPDYSNYDGTLMESRGPWMAGPKNFRFDSWRVPMNIALDYEWSCADAQWQRGYGERIQNFFYSQGVDIFHDQYRVDGSLPAAMEILQAGGYRTLRHSTGLVATVAAASVMCSHSKSKEFVDALWNSENKPYCDGYFDAYYDGLLRLFAFMHLSGNYRIIE